LSAPLFLLGCWPVARRSEGSRESCAFKQDDAPPERPEVSRAPRRAVGEANGAFLRSAGARSDRWIEPDPVRSRQVPGAGGAARLRARIRMSRPAHRGRCSVCADCGCGAVSSLAQAGMPLIGFFREFPVSCGLRRCFFLSDHLERSLSSVAWPGSVLDLTFGAAVATGSPRDSRFRTPRSFA